MPCSPLALQVHAPCSTSAAADTHTVQTLLLPPLPPAPPLLFRLDISGCLNLGDRSLVAISRLPHLACLNLCGCKGISNQGVAALAGTPSLTELNLAHSAVSDVAPLGTLPVLRALNIFGCHLSGEVPQWAQPGSPHSVAKRLRAL